MSDQPKSSKLPAQPAGFPVVQQRPLAERGRPWHPPPYPLPIGSMMLISGEELETGQIQQLICGLLMREGTAARHPTEPCGWVWTGLLSLEEWTNADQIGEVMHAHFDLEHGGYRPPPETGAGLGFLNAGEPKRPPGFLGRLQEARRADEFVRDLASAVNRSSMEGGSNTPDHVLANFMSKCLAALDEAVNARAAWYGRSDHPASGGGGGGAAEERIFIHGARKIERALGNARRYATEEGFEMPPSEVEALADEVRRLRRRAGVDPDVEFAYDVELVGGTGGIRRATGNARAQIAIDADPGESWRRVVVRVRPVR